MLLSSMPCYSRLVFFSLLLVQPVTEQRTLDLVITRSDRPVVVVDPVEISDHSLVQFQLSIQRPPLQFVDVSTRAWKSFDTDCFRDDLLRSPLCCPPNNYSDISVD